MIFSFCLYCLKSRIIFKLVSRRCEEIKSFFGKAIRMVPVIIGVSAGRKIHVPKVRHNSIFFGPRRRTMTFFEEFLFTQSLKVKWPPSLKAKWPVVLRVWMIQQIDILCCSTTSEVEDSRGMFFWDPRILQNVEMFLLLEILRMFLLYSPELVKLTLNPSLNLSNLLMH